MPGTLIEFFMPVVFFSSVKPFPDEGRCEPGTYVIRETDNIGVLELISIDGVYAATLHSVPSEIGTHPGVQFIYCQGQAMPRLHRIIREGKSGWEVTNSYKMAI